MKQTIGYRRYVSTFFGDHYVFVVQATDPNSESIQFDRYFVRWVDKEWQYEETKEE